MLERFEEAAEAARHAINCPDPTICAFVNYAIALHQLGRREAADSALADARARKPDLTRAQSRRSFQHLEPETMDKFERYLEALGVPE